MDLNALKVFQSAIIFDVNYADSINYHKNNY